MATPNNMIVYSPSPGTYVVMRLNPIETVRHLDDPIAYKEAQEMRPKSHLVILELERAPPAAVAQKCYEPLSIRNTVALQTVGPYYCYECPGFGALGRGSL
ncbi:hypothetical protein FKP32DRAFT_1601142 [Trametes sanguinea]|nr:hypothetical protein FKP32DRAFT_1601142 [Trametes sanguinea]